MYILVGLGNPGDKYKDTYHNVGFQFIDNLSARLGVKLKRAECACLTAVCNINGSLVVLAKPTTYMNLSGQAVKSLIAKYNADISDLIVVYDDIDLHRFSIRARACGSAGTHNGMKNIVELLNSIDVKRVRIGVGREQQELKDYVLSNIKKQDKMLFQKCYDRIADAICEYINKADFDALMRALNGKVGDEV